ncbi:MAG: DUF4411 family protein [Planctomycetota bacterium]|nr:DUF4411 family protein [Planctomycetota bacterium]
MTSSSPFVLDANVFIEASIRYYAFDIVPAFWVCLEEHGKLDKIFTIDRIAVEIKEDGPLKAWMHDEFAGFIRESNTPETLAHYAELMQWAQEQPFTDAAKAEFAEVADAWLVAHAKAVGATVVTHETFDAKCRRRVKIPNACRVLDVPCVDTFAMLRSLGVKLSK